MFVTTLKGFIFLDESDKETENIVMEVVQHTLLGGEDSGPTMDLKCLLVYFCDRIPTPMTLGTDPCLLTQYLLNTL